MAFSAGISDGTLRIQGDPDNLLGLIHMIECAIHTGASMIENGEGDPFVIVLREDKEQACLH